MTAPDLAPLRTICASVDFDLAQVESTVLERMRLLASCSETMDDAVRSATHADAIFRWYASHRPIEAFTELERRTVTLGCLFSDIGKTGPHDATADEQRLVVEMFAVEGVSDDTMPVERFFATYFPDAAERLARFRAMMRRDRGLDPSMTIRAFWNLHTGWTLAILEPSGVPLEAVAAAATHHFLDDINPEAIVSPSGSFSRSFGDNAAFDRAEKLVILLDKYDAVRRRGRRPHDGAITWLRERIAKHRIFGRDEELQSLVGVVAEVLG